MTPVSLARRRAEEFDVLVEGASTRGLRNARDADLLELVGALRAVPQVSARPEFVASLRERLLVEAESALAPPDLSHLRLPERRPARERRIAAAVAGLALVGTTTSLAVASQSAIPGDSLYSVKRALEDAHATLTFGDADKGATMLANASDRLDEVDALSKQDGAGDDVRIEETLGAFSGQVGTAADLLLADYRQTGHQSSVAELRDFARSSLERLARLQPQLPASADEELRQAATLLVQVDAEAVQTCPTCGGAPIGSLPSMFGLASTAQLSPGAGGSQGSDASQADGHPGSTGGAGGQPQVPSLGGELSPGGVLGSEGAQPSTGGSGGSGTDSNSGSGPVGSLTGGVRDGLDPSSGASLPPVPEVQDSIDGLLHGVTDPLTGTTPSP